MRQTRKAPPVSTVSAQQREITRLTRRVFVFESSKADIKYFRQQIHQWIVSHPERRRTWEQTLWNMLFVRNDDGRSCKYLKFHDRAQRLYIDRDFKMWAEYARNEIYNALKKYYA